MDDRDLQAARSNPNFYVYFVEHLVDAGPVAVREVRGSAVAAAVEQGRKPQQGEDIATLHAYEQEIAAAITLTARPDWQLRLIDLLSTRAEVVVPAVAAVGAAAAVFIAHLFASGDAAGRSQVARVPAAFVESNDDRAPVLAVALLGAGLAVGFMFFDALRNLRVRSFRWYVAIASSTLVLVQRPLSSLSRWGWKTLLVLGILSIFLLLPRLIQRARRVAGRLAIIARAYSSAGDLGARVSSEIWRATGGEGALLVPLSWLLIAVIVVPVGATEFGGLVGRQSMTARASRLVLTDDRQQIRALVFANADGYVERSVRYLGSDRRGAVFQPCGAMTLHTGDIDKLELHLSELRLVTSYTPRCEP